MVRKHEENPSKTTQRGFTGEAFLLLDLDTPHSQTMTEKATTLGPYSARLIVTQVLTVVSSLRRVWASPTPGIETKSPAAHS